MRNMIRKSIIHLIFIAATAISATAQDHFKVDLSNRAPDVKSLVMAYEGSSSIPFLANDVHGVEQSLMSMTGKTVMLWFWNNDCIKCHEQIDDLNLLAQKYPDNLQLVSFSDNTKEEVLSFIANKPVSFPVIPNSKTLSEGPYGGDLGYPKLFILDKNGRIKWVLPEVEMKNNFGAFSFLESLHVSLHQ